MNWAVIMAGGVGSRFWPASRKDHPKQFLSLFSEKTLIEETFDRVTQVVPKSNVLIFTQEDKVQKVKKLLKLPASQIVGEPVGRNTAPCAAWAAALIQKKDPSGVMALLPADAYIGKPKVFASALRLAFKNAKAKRLPVTLGIQPTRPHTGYGYLQLEKKPTKSSKLAIHRLKQFREKPNVSKAKKYLKSGNYLWNAGIFIWGAADLLATAQKEAPKVFKSVSEITQGKKTRKQISTLFKKCPSISIDYGLMEKLSGKILCIPTSMEWSDVGSWESLAELLDSRKSSSKPAKTVLVNSKNNYVRSDKLVACVGLEDMVIVDTEDVLLVCPKSESERVKAAVEELGRKKQSQYL